MAENSIKLKPINDLLDSQFFIPSYQRGYRWTEQQVTDLLDDIWEFSRKSGKEDKEFYCLQPIVVKGRGEKWELIDGQQRLTTIYIILSYLKADEIFDIEFETRKKSRDFLSKLSAKIDETNIDFFHISKAFEIINLWFDGKKTAFKYIKDKFKITLLEATEVIWYQVNDGSDAIDIFTRINMGKIPLTNAELIKALFLRSDNWKNKDAIALKQLQIAKEWDSIEYALQKDAFWYFLNPSDAPPPTRIEFIFDLMASDINRKAKAADKLERKHRNDYFSFLVFSKYFSPEKISEHWKEVKDYFMVFEEWFNDRNLYHQIGYLIAVGEKISELKNIAVHKTKTQFMQELTELIKSKVNYDWDALKYSDTAQKSPLKQLLLLFNVQTILKHNNSMSYFPFDSYKKQNWSLEHIHAQNSEGPTGEAQWLEWLKAHQISLKRMDKKEHEPLIGRMAEIIESLNSEKELDATLESKLKQLFEDTMNLFKTKDIDEDMHLIQNLALLDTKSNSAFNNSIFDVKRNLMIDREKKGSFIPVCTRNVFLKYYSKNASQLYFWTADDRIDYLNELKKVLKIYSPNPIK
jgi:Protein of unknown function DUF262